MSTSPEQDDISRQLTDAFLRWPLPPGVRADLCACDPDYKNRSGTNLLTFTEAKVMMDQVVMPVLAEKVETWKQTALDAQADLEAAEQQLLALAEPEARIADLEARLAAAESEVAGLRAALAGARKGVSAVYSCASEIRRREAMIEAHSSIDAALKPNLP